MSSNYSEKGRFIQWHRLSTAQLGVVPITCGRWQADKDGCTILIFIGEKTETDFPITKQLVNGKWSLPWQACLIVPRAVILVHIWYPCLHICCLSVFTFWKWWNCWNCSSSWGNFSPVVSLTYSTLSFMLPSLYFSSCFSRMAVEQGDT